jgi:hypothetical protein
MQIRIFDFTVHIVLRWPIGVSSLIVCASVERPLIDFSDGVCELQSPTSLQWLDCLSCSPTTLQNANSVQFGSCYLLLRRQGWGVVWPRFPASEDQHKYNDEDADTARCSLSVIISSISADRTVSSELQVGADLQRQIAK